AVQIANQALVSADDRVGEPALRGLQGQHLLLDRIARNQPKRKHGPRLSDAMRAVDGLGFDGGVPPRVQQKYVLGSREVQAEASRFQADEEQRAAVVLEPFDARLPI